ncbi:MsnO8 family LLM class oxidoreductase [Ornithinimicrobium pekingense]|uniref:Methylene-tetrahydromethanopterin reductase n=1 Tax=Ornithinimicrobium pekingense TaxID=384677 RepID=A0ABQ2F903_9MICO|nr:MsnO8 family LLM class oxidoreductase [Ornithinimicrobium pekingense]GGK73295.1 methylene-tetrahydromethanopterin reductase [Ornithinimicrobium pekingense]
MDDDAARPGTARLPVPVSLLDRSRTRRGEAPGDALLGTVERARRAEELGFRRFWVAEHHAVPGIASGSPPVLMAEVAARTSRIRVGSGGVMLAHHRPIVVAEQARMLEALHPGRIDLGLGRSLGFTAPVRRALGVERYGPERFAEDLAAVFAYLDDDGPVTAMPRGVDPPPVLVLATGSGLGVAARLGLPVVVGGPLLRGDLEPLSAYREAFRPSDRCAEPQVIISLDVMIAATRQEARELLLPEAWAMAESRATGAFPPLRPDPPERLTARQEGVVEQQLALSVHGTAEDVTHELTRLVERTGAVEVLASTSTYDRDALAQADAALAALRGDGLT